MTLELIIAVAALAVSGMSALFVWWQIRIATKATKAGLLTSIIDQIHQDGSLQTTIGFIYENALQSHVDEKSGETLIVTSTEPKDVTDAIDMLLNKFQILGHLLSLGVIGKNNLQTLEYEIKAIGRNLAIRSYLEYLNTRFIIKSGIVHDHFQFFKALYMDIEDDADAQNSFRRCLFDKSEANHLLRSAPKGILEQGTQGDTASRAP